MNTGTSFRDKWQQNPTAFFEETLRPNSDTQQWILQRNGFSTREELAEHLSSRHRILDAGCGNGRVTALLRSLTKPSQTTIVAIDANSAEVAQFNLAHYPAVEVKRADLLGDLAPLGTFDFIYCQEVLHHTGAPEQAFRNLAGRLEPGGELAVYVYRKKAPIREFVDDFIRERIAALPYEDAMRVAGEIARFGQALAGVPGMVEVPGIEALEIQAGVYSVQRLVYHFFMKCYWNPDVSFGENALVNYDWYHPQDCSRHTLDEVRSWFISAGLEIVHNAEDPYGITVRGVRPPRPID